MRKLASIQVVEAIEPIPGADTIERAKVLGWWVVIKKDSFKVGDKVVYCEVDSYLPERPEFEFLRKACYCKAIQTPEGKVLMRAGFRIRTVKLRGQVSQGICFPIEQILPKETWTNYFDAYHPELGFAPPAVGTDLTEQLGIEKYEPPIPAHLGGKVKGLFPEFLPKTDETRIQTCEGVLTRHAGKTLYMTEKLDGASCTIFLTKTERGVCSRNLLLDETDPDLTLGRLCAEQELFQKLEAFSKRTGRYLAIQAELIGPGIQKNRYGLGRHELRVFNILEIQNRVASLVPYHELEPICDELWLRTVPMLGTLTLNHTIDQLVEMSSGPSMLNPFVSREGLVFRPLQEEYDHELGRLSFKVINPEFLIRYEE